jgi:hypothetical protein
MEVFMKWLKMGLTLATVATVLGVAVAPAARAQEKKPNILVIMGDDIGWPANGFTNGSIAYWDSFKHEMWRFQIPGQIIAKYLPFFIECPPMQAGANFSIQDLKEKVEAAQKAAKAGNE